MMNHESISRGQFPQSEPNDVGEGIDPTPKTSDSLSNKPFWAFKTGSRGKRVHYKKLIRDECLQCTAGCYSEVRNCEVYSCAFWKHRVSMSRIHKAVVSGKLESLSDKDKLEAKSIAEKVAKAQSKEIQMAERHCPRSAGKVRIAVSKLSRAAAVPFYCLQCSNFQPNEVRICHITRCVLHKHRPYQADTPTSADSRDDEEGGSR